jgi:hypothetical protein
MGVDVPEESRGNSAKFAWARFATGSSTGMVSMSLVYSTLFAAKASGTHHKLAMSGLTRLDRHDADDWRDLFLSEIDLYLKGAKAPDDEFKDFKNHVLHVGENDWGGAISACKQWYAKTVEAFGQKNWKDGVYNFGVLTHYLTDPVMPFHTGQSERETVIHRAAEWSVTKAYDELAAMLQKDLGGWPNVEVAESDDWLAKLVKAGAVKSHAHYDFLIDHYNFDVGVKSPAAGWDRESKEVIARLLGWASCAIGKTLERVIDDAGVFPPHVVLSVQTLIASLNVPMKFITGNITDAKDRAQVEAMYLEFKRTGKVLESMPADDRAIRKAHCEEVRKTPLAQLDAQKPGPIGAKWSGPAVLHKQPPAKPTPAKPDAKEQAKAPPKTEPQPRRSDERATDNGKAAVNVLASGGAPLTTAPQKSVVLRRDDLSSPTPPAPHASASAGNKGASDKSDFKFHLSTDMELEAAPSIGPKTADRFAAHGIKTVEDFLTCDVEAVSRKLGAGHFDSDTLREWQDQASLMCDVPNLRGHDSQILTGIGIRNGEELARANARDLFEMVEEFCQTSAGQRILRSSKKPDLAEVGSWIVSAKRVRHSAKA